MSVARGQAQINAPVLAVWQLLGDPNRHPEWWPRIVEARCEDLGEGCSYKQVTKGPLGVAEETVVIDRLDDCREVRIRCLDTGTYMSWQLAGVRDGTFLDVEFGMDPAHLPHKVFDMLAGRRFYRGWLQQSIEALRSAAERSETEGKPIRPDEGSLTD
jgi:Polyketide cyclase / dehydrase and lipid transport